MLNMSRLRSTTYAYAPWWSMHQYYLFVLCICLRTSDSIDWAWIHSLEWENMYIRYCVPLLSIRCQRESMISQMITQINSVDCDLNVSTCLFSQWMIFLVIIRDLYATKHSLYYILSCGYKAAIPWFVLLMWMCRVRLSKQNKENRTRSLSTCVLCDCAIILECF